MDYNFRHLDPSVTKTYRGTVLYGFEPNHLHGTYCFYAKVKNGYVVETPVTGDYHWVRGQHITTLEPFMNQIKPIRIIHDGY